MVSAGEQNNYTSDCSSSSSNNYRVNNKNTFSGTPYKKPYGAVDTPKFNTNYHSSNTNVDNTVKNENTISHSDIQEQQYHNQQLNKHDSTQSNESYLQADGNMQAHHNILNNNRYHSHSDDESNDDDDDGDVDSGSGSEADIENSTIDKSIISTITHNQHNIISKSNHRNNDNESDIVYNKKGNIKQRRVSLACLNCKLAKTRCDNDRPCKRCLNTGRVNTCINGKKQKRGRKKGKRKLLLASKINTNNANHTVSSALSTPIHLGITHSNNNTSAQYPTIATASSTNNPNYHTLLKMAEMCNGSYDVAVANQQAVLALALAQSMNQQSNQNYNKSHSAPLLIAPQPISATNNTLQHSTTPYISTTPNQCNRTMNGYSVSPQQYRSPTDLLQQNNSNNISPSNPMYQYLQSGLINGMSSAAPCNTAYNQMVQQNNSNIYNPMTQSNMYHTMPYSTPALSTQPNIIDYNTAMLHQQQHAALLAQQQQQRHSIPPYQSIATTPMPPQQRAMSSQNDIRNQSNVITPSKNFFSLHPYHNLTPVIDSASLFRQGSNRPLIDQTNKSMWLTQLHYAANNVLTRLNITITQLQNAPYTFPTHRVAAFTWCSKFLADCIAVTQGKSIQPYTAEPVDMERDKTTVVALESQKSIQYDMPVGLVCICLWPHPFQSYTPAWCNNSMSTQLGYSDNTELNKLLQTLLGITTIYSCNNLEQSLFKFIEAVCSNQMRYELQTKYINHSGFVVDAIETNNIQYSSTGSGIPLWITGLVKLDDINNSNGILLNNNNIQNMKTLQSNSTNTFKPIQFESNNNTMSPTINRNNIGTSPSTPHRQQSALSIIADTAIGKDKVNSKQLPDLTQRQPIHLYNSSSSS